MPRVPRNPGSGKKPFNGPAMGAGAGQWGGKAKGASTSRITPENARALLALRDDPAAKAVKDEIAARMLSVLVDVAETDQSGAARANAADKALDRLFGKAMQRVEQGPPGAFVMIGEPEAEDAEAWQQKYGAR